MQLTTLADLCERSETLKTNRRVGEDLFTSFLTKAGFDVEKFEKIREENQTELNRILEEMETECAQQSSAVKDALGHDVDRLRKSMEHFEEDFPHFPKPIVLDSPFLIAKYSNPPSQPESIVILDYHIEPWNSWVKATLRSRTKRGLMRRR
jgi:hypothetical protein